MTRPGVASLDDIPVYELVDQDMRWPATVPARDALGREWLIPRGGDKGFLAPAAPRTRREDRPDSDGSYSGAEYRSSKTVSLTGRVWVPRTLRDQTELELAGLCADPVRSYSLRRRTAQSDLVREVKLDGEPQWEWITRRRLDFSFQFWAADPRKHDFRWQEPRATPPQIIMNGLDYDGAAGLDYSGGGLDYGAVGEDFPAQVANYGTDVARPFFELRGPMPTPTVVHVETGVALRYRDDLADGERVRLNTDEFPARGLVARSSTSTRRGDVSSLWVVPTWPQVDPRAVASFRLLTPGPPESLTVALRSAYR